MQIHNVINQQPEPEVDPEAEDEEENGPRTGNSFQKNVLKLLNKSLKDKELKENDVASPLHTKEKPMEKKSTATTSSTEEKIVANVEEAKSNRGFDDTTVVKTEYFMNELDDKQAEKPQVPKKEATKNA